MIKRNNCYKTYSNVQVKEQNSNLLRGFESKNLSAVSKEIWIFVLLVVGDVFFQVNFLVNSPVCVFPLICRLFFYDFISRIRIIFAASQVSDWLTLTYPLADLINLH